MLECIRLISYIFCGYCLLHKKLNDLLCCKSNNNLSNKNLKSYLLFFVLSMHNIRRIGTLKKQIRLNNKCFNADDQNKMGSSIKIYLEVTLTRSRFCLSYFYDYGG